MFVKILKKNINLKKVSHCNLEYPEIFMKKCKKSPWIPVSPTFTEHRGEVSPK